MILFFWLVLLTGLFLLAWVLGIKARGSFEHWVRPFRTESCQVVGRTFPDKTPASKISQFLVDANAFVRSKEQRSAVVKRAWDHGAETIFVGLVLQRKCELADLENNEGYEIRELPAMSVVRASGSAKSSDITPTESLTKYLAKRDFTVDMTRPMLLSGQSFHLYQWPATEEFAPSNFLQKIMEKTYQLRDILIFPILLTVLALGLIGTRQFILFPIGIGLIILLSGAGKFVLLHQMKDESEEFHLQNY